MQLEKKTIEEKYNKIVDHYQKLLQSNSNNKKFNNSIEMLETLKNNDLLKILGRFKGTEKLIETCKNGFNESLRELLFEISALKNFIFYINQEICNFINIKVSDLSDKSIYMESSLIQMPFLDIIHKVKKIYRNNMDLALYRKEPCESRQFMNEVNNDELEQPYKLKEGLLGANKNDKIEKSNPIKKITPRNNTSSQNKAIGLFEKEDDKSISVIAKDNDLDDRENTNIFDNEKNDISNFEEREFLKKKWMETLFKK